jgi:hypothetical protein
MRSILTGIIMMSASMALAADGQGQRRSYAQAVIIDPQPDQESRESAPGVVYVHSEEDALTRRINQDNERIDRLIDICPSC